MPRTVACAVVRDDPPQVFVAEDQQVLNWVLALKLIARTPGRELPDGLADSLREALRDERWGDAVVLWMENRREIDVYPSFELYDEHDIEMGHQELEFSPLFTD